MRTKHKSERGQAIVFLALGMVALISMTALALDGGNAFAMRRHAQNAADTAALAAAVAKIDKLDWQQAGLDRAASNGFTDTNAGVNSPATPVDVVVVSPPTSGPYAGNSQYVQVVIRTSVQTFFASIVNVDTVGTRVEAVARARPGTTEQMFMGNAIVGIAPTGCAVFKMGGTQATEIKGSGIFVNSNDPKCAFDQSGASGVLSVEGNITVVGGAMIKFPLNIKGVVQTGANPYPYPPVYEIPTPTCSQDGVVTDIDKKTSKLTPGNYGNFPPKNSNSEILLEPGIYCINGTFDPGSKNMTGSEVLFYLKPVNRFSWNANSKLVFSAPTSGIYKNLLVYADPGSYTGNVPDCTINGTSDSSWVGTVYAPYCDISITGTGGSDGLKSQVIGYTVELSGTSNTKIQYNDAENYDGTVPPALELSQ